MISEPGSDAASKHDADYSLKTEAIMSSNLLRAARLRAGLSQKDLQAKLAARGVILCQPTLSHYETGRRVPVTMAEIVAMARVLHVESQTLVNYFADRRADYARSAYLEKLTHDDAW